MKFIYIKSSLSAALLFLIITGIILIRVNGNAYISANNISNVNPEPVLIIDAGHGGADGGAVAKDGTRESIINLSIASKLESLCKLFGVNPIMTRISEELDYPSDANSIALKKRWDQNRRLELINSFQNAILISIHQNKYPDSRPSGPQVLYAPNDDSKALGELTHNMLNDTLCSHNRRVASPIADNIYLINKAKCPAILVECGFISNESELYLLLNDNYQKQIASVIFSSYISYINQ